ncbi:hypothetical protein DERF_011893 [Dermatophagoides farinae]|uniref:Uncharacterized protein n=1 Tax=Dermatophagoides farinae TaxID=6954 RepID=A0A922HSH0_DERFA|nr:hypothetical protein DERF_011893 [Dermatophagoides farinae]
MDVTKATQLTSTSSSSSSSSSPPPPPSSTSSKIQEILLNDIHQSNIDNNNEIHFKNLQRIHDDNDPITKSKINHQTYENVTPFSSSSSST